MDETVKRFTQLNSIASYLLDTHLTNPPYFKTLKETMQLTCVFCKMLRIILLRVFIILIFLRDCSFNYKRILTLVKTGFVSGSLTGFLWLIAFY